MSEYTAMQAGIRKVEAAARKVIAVFDNPQGLPGDWADRRAMADAIEELRKALE